MPQDAAVCMRCGFQFNSPFQNPPTPQYASYPHPQSQPQTSTPGLAIASLVLGIVALLSICGWFVSAPCAVLAVIFGVISRSVDRSGLATAGLVCGIIAGCLNLVWVAIFVAAMLAAPPH